MAFLMTRFAQGDTVRYFVSKALVRSKWFYMMWMEFHRFAVPFFIASTAVLAGVIITFKYSMSPFFVFHSIPSNSVLVALVLVALPSCLVSLFSLLPSHGFGKFGAFVRTILSNSAPLDVFWHYRAAMLAIRRFFLTFLANTIEGIRCAFFGAAYITNDPACSNVGCKFGCTGSASVTLCLYTHPGYCVGWLTTQAARLHSFINAILAHPKVACRGIAKPAFSLIAHKAIITYCGSSGDFQRYADAFNITPELITEETAVAADG